MFEKIKRSKRIFAVLMAVTMMAATISPLYASAEGVEENKETPVVIEGESTESVIPKMEEKAPLVKEEVLVDTPKLEVVPPEVTEPEVTEPEVTEPMEEKLTEGAETDTVLVTYIYAEFDSDGNWIQTLVKKTFPKGTTHAEAIAEGKKRESPEAYENFEFAGWSGSIDSDQEPIVERGFYHIQATYKNQCIVTSTYRYFDVKGLHKEVTEARIIEKGIGTYEEVIQKAQERDTSDMYGGSVLKIGMCRILQVE